MLGGPRLDRIDLKILTQLQQSGRITNVELADAVGLSPSPCLTRVKRLERLATSPAMVRTSTCTSWANI